MNELYWITRCDGILAVIIIPMVILLVLAVVLFIMSGDPPGEAQQKVLSKRATICGSIGLFLLIAQVFVPTTNQALAIYGIGGIIDYVKSNETAKQLPNKVIIALDKYLESINEETKEKE